MRMCVRVLVCSCKCMCIIVHIVSPVLRYLVRFCRTMAGKMSIISVVDCECLSGQFEEYERLKLQASKFRDSGIPTNLRR